MNIFLESWKDLRIFWCQGPFRRICPFSRFFWNMCEWDPPLDAACLKEWDRVKQSEDDDTLDILTSESSCHWLWQCPDITNDDDMTRGQVQARNLHSSLHMSRRPEIWPERNNWCYGCRGFWERRKIQDSPKYFANCWLSVYLPALLSAS